MSSDHMLPVYYIFVDSLKFDCESTFMGFSNNHKLIQSYDTSFNNATLSVFMERLCSYKF